MPADAAPQLLDASGLQELIEAPDTEESRNFWLYGPGDWTAVALNVQQDTLAYAEGGFDLAQPKAQPRLVAVPGPGCTILGIARTLDSTFNAAAASDAEKLTTEEVARALYVYNTKWLGAPFGGASPPLVPILPEFRVGCHFTLPIEPQLGTGADRLVTNLTAMRGWAAAFPEADEFWLRHAEARLLEVPDPEALAAAVSASLAGASVAAIASALARDLLRNADDAVFGAVETLLQLRKSRKADTVRVVLAVLTPLEDQHAELLGWGTGGHAVLRQFHFVLYDTDLLAAANPNAADLAAARGLVARGLGLEPVPGVADEWKDPREWGPKVEPTEPPLPPKQRVSTESIKGGTPLAAMAFGRVIPVGSATAYPPGNPKWVGASHPGEDDPVTWWKGHTALLQHDLGPQSPPVGTGVPVIAAKVIQRIDVAARIAMNEGLLDSCRAADKGLISTGLHQWSAHVGEELPVLLERFRVQAPEHYDLFFGMFELQTKVWLPPQSVQVEITEKGKKKKVWRKIELDDTHPDFSAAKVELANPFGRDPSDAYAYFPSYATLFEVPPGAAPRRLPPVDDDLKPRLVFFGGTEGNVHRFSPAWSARVRLAGKYSVPYRVAQLHTAAWRLTRIQLDATFNAIDFTVDGQRHSFADLFPTTIGAALVLDQHINAPWFVKASVQAAIDRTPGTPHKVDGSLDEAWLRRFTINFMAVRRFPDAPAKRDRDGRILTFHDLPAPSDPAKPDRSLSPDPGTFTGW